MNDLRLARILSVAGHPLVLIPLTVALTTRNWRLAAIIAATTTLPLTVIVIRQVRRGAWSDFDVSRRDERSGLYYAAIPLLVIGAVVAWATGAGPRILKGFAASTAMLTAGLLGNRLLKISLHMMFAAYCVVLTIRTEPLLAAGVVPFLLAIAWSRWRLERHTPAEIAVGSVLGAAAGFYVI
jgi:hypothetical protein